MKKAAVFFLIITLQATGQLIWHNSQTGLPADFVPRIFAVNQNNVIYVGGERPESGPDYLAIYKSTDQGQAWTEVSLNGLNASGIITGLIFCNNKMFIAGPINGYSRLQSSSDDGKTWQAIQTGINEWEFEKLITTSSGAIFLTAIMPANYAKRLYRSTDGGTSWTQVDLDQFIVSNEWFNIDYVHGKLILSVFKSNSQYLHSSTNDALSWKDLQSVFTPTCGVINITGGPLQEMYANCVSNGKAIVTRSLDGGKSWQQCSSIGGLQEGFQSLSLFYHQGTFLWSGADFNLNHPGSRLMRSTIPHVETSLEEIPVLNRQIWPVPATDVLFFEDNSLVGGSELIVTDMYGRCVLNKEITSGEIEQLNISGLDPGMYILSTSEKRTLKFIKQ